MQNNARHAYRTAKNNDKMHKYARKMHKNGGSISAFKARRSDNSDDEMWF